MAQRRQIKDNDDDRLVTMREIAERLNVTLMTISTWRRPNTQRVALEFETAPKGAQRHYVRIRESKLLDYLRAYRPDLAKKWLHPAAERSAYNYDYYEGRRTRAREASG